MAASGATTTFSATFDGNDSTATGGGFVGLFGDVTGTIGDVGLLDVNVTNTRTAGANFGRTGALAGILSPGGTVRGSYVAGGSVTHTTGSNSTCLIGCLLGYSEGTVRDSYATCNVAGANLGALFLGGLISVGLWRDGSVSHVEVCRHGHHRAISNPTPDSAVGTDALDDLGKRRDEYRDRDADTVAEHGDDDHGAACDRCLHGGDGFDDHHRGRANRERVGYGGHHSGGQHPRRARNVDLSAVSDDAQASVVLP